MSVSEEWLDEKFGAVFQPIVEEQELFIAYGQDLLPCVDEEGSAILAQFGRVGISSFYID